MSHLYEKEISPTGFEGKLKAEPSYDNFSLQVSCVGYSYLANAEQQKWSYMVNAKQSLSVERL